MDKALSMRIIEEFPGKVVKNGCGDFTLQQSASIVKQANALLTNDTGLMHIASCFEIPVISIWGNTVPSLGMYPYFPKKPTYYSIHEVKNLSCRPCSKIGYATCPKGHFRCMLEQDSMEIARDIEEKIKILC